MKDLETLMIENPTKTASEILKLHEFEKEAEKEKVKANFIAMNKEKLDIVEELNKVKYYKGTFGKDQHYMYKVFNAQLDSSNNIMIDVEKIVMFIDAVGNLYSLEREVEKYEEERRYSLKFEEEMLKDEWEKINNCIDSIKDFWN